jgi:hypothetical protein
VDSNNQPKDLKAANQTIVIIFEQAQLDGEGGGMFLVRMDHEGRKIDDVLLEGGNATVMEQFAAWTMDVIMGKLAQIAAQNDGAELHRINKNNLN